MSLTGALQVLSQQLKCFHYTEIRFTFPLSKANLFVASFEVLFSNLYAEKKNKFAKV